MVAACGSFLPVLNPVVTWPACRYLLCCPAWQLVLFYVTSVQLSSWINEGDCYDYYSHICVLLFMIECILTVLCFDSRTTSDLQLESHAQTASNRGQRYLNITCSFFGINDCLLKSINLFTKLKIYKCHCCLTTCLANISVFIYVWTHYCVRLIVSQTWHELSVALKLSKAK